MIIAPEAETHREAVLSILMRSVLSLTFSNIPVAHCRSTPTSEGRLIGVPHALTLGGSYTSFRSSMWKIDTNSFRAVATIASFELLRLAKRS